MYVSFLSGVKMNLTNQPAPIVWVFIAQLVEYCSTINTEAMGLNPVEVPKMFSVNFQLLKLQLPLPDDHILIYTGESFEYIMKAKNTLALPTFYP